MTSVLTPAPAPATRSRPPRPNGWLVIGGIVTALLIAAGALSVAGWLGYRSEVQHASYDHVASTIAIELATGDIRIVPGEPGRVTVTRTLRWSFEKPTVTEEWDGQTLRLGGGCRYFVFGPPCKVDYSLAVPAQVTVEAHTSTGDISVQGIEGALNVRTSTGDIRVADAAGPLTMHSSTGDISAAGLACATVDASASTGDIRLDFIASPVTVGAKASTGDITIRVPSGPSYRVRAHASTGDVHIGVAQDDGASRRLTADTSTGDIDIGYR